MKVLVACEFSGVVRDAFRARGHDAWSCDLLPCEADPQWHIQGDALEAMRAQHWDLMIAHPPCTFLANSGARWLFEHEGRWQKLDDGAAFFRSFMEAPIDRIAIENPMPHKWAAERIGRHYDFAVQPWEYGDEQKKMTCFWVKNLPYLWPTDIRLPPTDKEKSKAWESIWRAAPGPEQKKNRSRTFPGIAAAMADQWGRLGQ